MPYTVTSKTVSAGSGRLDLPHVMCRIGQFHPYSFRHACNYIDNYTMSLPKITEIG